MAVNLTGSGKSVCSGYWLKQGCSTPLYKCRQPVNQTDSALYLSSMVNDIHVASASLTYPGILRHEKKIVIWGYPYKQSVWGNLMFTFEPSYSFHIEYTFSSYLGSIALYLNSIKFGLDSLHLTNIQKFWIS